MALSLINTTTNSGSSAAPSVTAPAGSSGDLLVVIVSHNDGTLTNADNNGATPTTEDLDYDVTGGGAGGLGMTIYHRVIGGSEPATYDYTMSGSNRWAVAAFLVRGQHADIYDVAPTGSAASTLPGTTVDSGSISTLTNNAWSIAVGQIDSAAVSWNTGSPGGSWVEIATLNAQEPVKVSYLEKATAGATGAITLTAGASSNLFGLLQFAIKAAAVASTTNQHMTMMGVG